jgi:uncharacterized coiled-coil protein SlyX
MEDRREGEDDRRGGFHLRLPRIRFLRPLVYLAVAAVVAMVVLGWWNYWRLGAEIVERDKIIAVFEDSVAAQSDTIAGLRVIVVETDTALVRSRRETARVNKRVSVLLTTLSERPTQVIRVPGQPPVIVIDGEPATPEQIAGKVERCNTLAVACADLQVRYSLDSIAADSTIAARDDVIEGHVEKDRLQAQVDSTKDEQITALKKRSAGRPFTVVLGPGLLYDLGGCPETTVQTEYFDGFTTTTTSNGSCDKIKYGIGITAGLDLVWLTDKLVKGFKLIGG